MDRAGLLLSIELRTNEIDFEVDADDHARRFVATSIVPENLLIEATENWSYARASCATPAAAVVSMTDEVAPMYEVTDNVTPAVDTDETLLRVIDRLAAVKAQLKLLLPSPDNTSPVTRNVNEFVERPAAPNRIAVVARPAFELSTQVNEAVPVASGA